jgi:DNA-binding transcriptional ArsR family regulator
MADLAVKVGDLLRGRPQDRVAEQSHWADSHLGSPHAAVAGLPLAGRQQWPGFPGLALEYFANNYFAKLTAWCGAAWCGGLGEGKPVGRGESTSGSAHRRPADRLSAPRLPAAPGRPSAGLGHPLRLALLDLLARRPTLTSTEAARALGETSGACSFHLRQLERYGQVEAVPGEHGRARPWRLVTGRPSGPGPAADEFGELARELENEGYRRWLAGRDTAPAGWHDEAFSTVLTLTPAELSELAGAIRAIISEYGRKEHAAGEETSVLPVGVVARLFPLLPPRP